MKRCVLWLMISTLGVCPVMLIGISYYLTISSKCDAHGACFACFFVAVFTEKIELDEEID